MQYFEIYFCYRINSFIDFQMSNHNLNAYELINTFTFIE